MHERSSQLLSSRFSTINYDKAFDIFSQQQKKWRKLSKKNSLNHQICRCEISMFELIYMTSSFIRIHQLYNQIKTDYCWFIIDYMDSSQSQPGTKQINRDFKCPCGKTYLSNAAIFTHIKHKHGGVAPGPIQKPVPQNKPRGRPPLSSKNKNSSNERIAQPPKQEIMANRQYYQAFTQIYTILAELYTRQEFNPQIWQNVQTFKRMEEFIQSRQRPNNFRFMGVCIGIGLSQFLKEMSQGLQKYPWRFEQVLILFILLLQYAIDENNKTSIIEQAPVELLIDFINPFIKQHIKDYAQYLEIEQLWIMKEQNMTKVFLCFYNWLKWKEYTQYCITVI